MIGTGEILERKSTLRNTKPLPEQTSPPGSRSTNSSNDSADYTDESYTGEEDTGDSGFGDARPFLKVNIAGSRPTAKPVGVGPSSASGSEYYKTLGTPDSVEGYTTVASYRDTSGIDQAGE